MQLGDHFVICDVCGKKIRKSQSRLIKDRYNTLNNLLVCSSDYDQTNPQNIPYTPKEKLLKDPTKVRPEAAVSYVSQSVSDRLPGAPRNLIARASLLSDLVELFWEGPIDTGSDRIIGYTITRADPQYSYQFTIESNTNTSTTYYLDLTSDTSTEYTYTVAAITEYGTGSSSNIAPYPVDRVDSSVNYLTASQTNYVITTGTGVAIIL